MNFSVCQRCSLFAAVTAECVETAGQAERLRRIGCDTGQGWLYSRAVTPEGIDGMIGISPLAV
ncbi:hypothetical protein OG729_38360 [Streptomyces sp. NBC_00210]|uniref:hypothetical protein n=1 Tax=unclassified Streptomyces TaxID=2593676 RepID=UPI003245B0B4